MFASRVVASVTVLVVALSVGRMRLARGVPARPALAAGVLDVVANVAMLYELQAGMLALMSVLASSYPAATVLMARLVLGERSGRAQQAGLVLAAVSVALIAGTPMMSGTGNDRGRPARYDDVNEDGPGLTRSGSWPDSTRSRG